MFVPDELYDLLEHIQSQLPSEMHKKYEEAADRALQHHSQHHGFEWWEHEGEVVVVPFFGVLIGLIVGVVLMYLFDPDHGEARRAQLLEQVNARMSEMSESHEKASD